MFIIKQSISQPKAQGPVPPTLSQPTCHLPRWVAVVQSWPRSLSSPRATETSKASRSFKTPPAVAGPTRYNPKCSGII